MTTAAPALHQSFLVWRGGFYAKLASAISLLSIALYWVIPSDEPPNGGTVLGYILGTAGLALIVWLAWFGIRRRRYGGAGSLEHLLSAHVYLGLALIVLATLHTGLRLHWNVHGFAYVLLLGVVGSGVFGAYAFWRYPPLMTGNRNGAKLGGMAADLAALDLRCRELALGFPDAVVGLVTAATAPPGKGAIRPSSAACLAAITAAPEQLGQAGSAATAEVLALVQALTQRAALCERVTRDRRYRALMLLWRAVHVPLTLGLLAALFIHVFVVFYDW